LLITSLFIFLGITLSSVQTIPAFRFIQQSDIYVTGRATQNSGLVAVVREELTNPKSQLQLAKERIKNNGILAVLPNAFGDPVKRDYVFPEQTLLNNYYETASYVGLLTLIFAIIGLYLLIRKKSYFWVTSLILSFLIFTKIPYIDLLSFLPILSKINLGRLRFVFILSAVVLAAISINTLQKWLLKKVKRKNLVHLIMAGLTLLLLIDLYSNVSYLIGYQDKSLSSFKDNKVLQYLADNNDARFIGLSPSRNGIGVPLIPNQSMLHGIYDIRGYFVMQPSKFFPLATRYLSRDGNNYFADDVFSRNFLNLYSIKYLVCANTDCSKYEDQYPIIIESKNSKVLVNDQALPRAFISYNVASYKSPGELYQALESNDANISKTVLIQDYDGPALSSDQTIDGANITKYKPDHISISVNAKHDGLLVLTDNFYPGWKAFVDNAEKEIIPVYGSLRGVFIDAGEHEITFQYRPVLFGSSIFISLVSALLIILFSYIFRFKPGK